MVTFVWAQVLHQRHGLSDRRAAIYPAFLGAALGGTRTPLISLLVSGAFVAWLLLTSRREDARAVASFIPDCLLLVRRLITDDRVPHRRKLLLVALLGYLAMPFDLIPDFIPVAGQLDDVIIVVAVLRSVLRAGGLKLLREHWPGQEASLNVLLRLTHGGAVSTRA